MKKSLFIIALFLTLINFNASAQKDGNTTAEQFGNTLNIGVGAGYRGYYGYGGRPWSALILNYEFSIGRNFTLAPFVGISTYSDHYYWGNKYNPYRNYTYRETSLQLGVKGVYYFDELLRAGEKWDFYAGLSIGFETSTTTWDYAYYGDEYVSRTVSPLYISGHIGARYHATQRVGIFLDLSSSYSSLGLSVKF